MSKKVSYVKMLKEAISEWDTSKTVDVKGPMLDPILSYKGDGELPTNKDAASILERYYFDEGKEQGIEEADYEIDTGKVGDSAAMKHTEGPGGEEQAGTAASKTIDGAKDEKEKDIVKEEEEPEEKEDEKDEKVEECEKPLKEEEEKEEDKDEEEVEEAAILKHLLNVLKEQDEEPEKKEDEKKEEEVKEQDESAEEKEGEEDKKEEVKEDVEMENSIIEKLISEMESDGDDFYGGDFEDSMEEEGGSKDFDSASMKHTEGPGGEEQAGTGDADTLIPDRKDIHDKVVEPPDLKEARDIIASLFEQEAEAEEEPEEKELDVDKEVKQEAGPVPSAMVGGPSPHKKGEDWDLEEAFKLFREEVEDEEEPEEKEDKVKVEKIDPRRIRV